MYNLKAIMLFNKSNLNVTIFKAIQLNIEKNFHCLHKMTYLYYISEILSNLL